MKCVTVYGAAVRDAELRLLTMHAEYMNEETLKVYII